MNANGRLDTRTLAPVDGWAFLAAPTAAAWNAGCNEMVRLGYKRPSITAPDGAYRTYDRQVYWKQFWSARGLPGNAATPGYSNHGWGTAVDIFNVYQYPRDVIRAVFAKYGFTFNVPSEQWHMQHNGTWPAGGNITPIAPTPTPIPELPEEEEMKITQAHYKRDTDGKLTRILYVPGTAWYIAWIEGGEIANEYARRLETGSSIEITQFIADQIRGAAARCAK